MEGTTRHCGQEEAKDMEEKLVVNLQISREIRKKKPISMFNSPGQEDDSKIYLNLIIEITNSNFEVFLFSEAPLRISKVQLSFPFSF